MIIYNLHFKGSIILPFKNNSPLIVNSYAVKLG